jgi:DNA-binding SARP family transcriptional activator
MAPPRPANRSLTRSAGEGEGCYNPRMLEFRILGPLEVWDRETALQLGGQKQRAVLALLALHPGEVVPSERLITELWGESPPRTAATALQNAISQLRKTLGADTLETRAPGYALRVEKEAVDAYRFEQLLNDARGVEPGRRAELLREALQLWRGPPLGDFAYESFAQNEAARLDELRLTALEERIEAELELGRAGDLVGELEGLVRENPLRERPRGQLMLALYRSGRQAEALQTYQETRRTLVDELGIEPTPALQQLHASILRQESVLEPGVVREAGDDRIGEVLRALLGSRLVPVLGPGPLPGTNGDDLAGRLAEVFDCPNEHRGDLTRVSQYVAVTQGVGPLYDALHSVFSEESEPGPVERFLARIAPVLREHELEQQLVVTTGYGRALERAFDEAGEEVDIVSYVAIGPDRGRFMHRRPDGSETVVAVPNTYAELSLDQHPIILKVHGDVDVRPERGRESFVVSEDDYIAYLAQTDLANVVPVTLAAKLRRSHLLFFGYPVVEWSLRVFLHRVFGDQPISYRSWAVLPGAKPVQREFWRERGVDLYDAPLGDYVAELERRLLDLVPARQS